MTELSSVETTLDTARPAPRPSARRLHGTPYPSGLSRALLALARLQTARWNFELNHVEAAQLRSLRAIVGHASATQFGRAHGFASIRSYEQYAAQVPIADYDAFCPAIERMRAGEAGVLVPERVRYFANSSGSSRQGRGKFLPITERQIAQQRRAGADALFRYLAHARDAQYLTGFTLGLFPPTGMRAQGTSLITSNPALMVTRMPRLTRPVYLPSDDIQRMSNYDAKLHAIAAHYLDHDVRAIAGTTCWFPLLLERVLQTAAARGRPVRSVSELWPNLRLLLGGGVAAAPYLPMLRKLLGHDFSLLDTYNATEGGIYAASDFCGEPGLLVLPHRGTFFEFQPTDSHRPRGRVPLWGVELERDYSLVVTTLSGLYAYEIGDIVRFKSLRPLRIEFVGRLSGCLSLTQELTTHVEIEHAVAHALSTCGGRTVDFGAAADVGAAGAKSRYVLYVEFDAGAEPVDLAAFAAAFDAGLSQQNRVYREHRAGEVALLPARVVSLPRGAAQRFLHRTTSGNLQGKFPRIVDAFRQQQLLEQLATCSD